MDLRLYARVLWRFRLLVAVGVVLATVLASLSILHIDPGGSPMLSYRHSEQWVSRATLLITEPEFPEGRSVFEQVIPPASSTRSQNFAPPFADPERFVRLANLYAHLVMSDRVRRAVIDSGAPLGVIEAAPVVTMNGASSLPLLSIGGISTSPAASRELTRRAVLAFLDYLETEQTRSGIPDNERVVLEVVRQPSRAQLLKGQPMTLPIVVFLAVLLAMSGLAFLLENMRPRSPHPLAAEIPQAEQVQRRRRSA